MRVFDNIRKWFGDRKLRKKAADLHRKPRVTNLDMARKVGILYQAEDEEQFGVIRDFVKHLKNEHGIREAMALAYVDDRDYPAYLYPRLEFERFCRKDLNWFMQPRGVAVENFMASGHDILIDLSDGHVLPLQYMVVGSNAAFKVGGYRPGLEWLYDLMIKHEEEPEDLGKYLEFVDHYLTIINKKDAVH